MSKYEDLHHLIVGDKTFDLTASECLGAKIALQWLDQNIDEVPGLILTRSDMVEAFGEEYAGWATHRLARIGYTVAPDPDPEPTNAELLEHRIRESGLDITGFLGNDATNALARSLDGDGVKAPGGENDGR